jgi:hypothetical protein
VARSAGGKESPHVGQRPGEDHADSHRLPDQVAEGDGKAEEAVQGPADGEDRMEEAPLAGRQVPRVTDEQVVGALPDPGQVLHLVGGEKAVGSRQVASLGGDRNERGDREDHQRQQAEQLYAVESQEGAPGPINRLRPTRSCGR